MRLLQPSSFLVDPDSLCHDIVLAVSSAGSQLLHCDDLPSGVEVEHYPGELWTAPPILLHAHLESFDAPSSAWRRDDFTTWVQELLAWRNLPGRMSAEQSANASWSELRNAGCGAVLASMSEPGAIPSASKTLASGGVEYPQQCLTIPEIFSPDPKQLEMASAVIDDQIPGIALHAPFSVSEAVAEKAFQWLNSHPGRVLSIHLGEHADERQFLQSQCGPMADLLLSRGREGKGRTWKSPVDWLEDVAPGAIPGTLAVHCGDLNPTELQQLIKKQVQVVWCPGTHLYFDRPRPAFEEAGMEAPLLGCDSRASNEVLDPMREVRLARQILPEFGPSAWWRALTERAAAAWPGVAQSAVLKKSKFGWNPSFGHLPLRFSDPTLPSAIAVCDYLTSEADLAPLAPAGNFELLK